MRIYFIILTALKHGQNCTFKARDCHMLQIVWYFELPGFGLIRFYCNVAGTLSCALTDMKGMFSLIMWNALSLALTQ
jgi:hypothetical protein